MAEIKLAINPSSQMHNVGVSCNYIEGTAMLDLGERLKTECNKLGVTNRLFWSGKGDSVSWVRREIKQANNYNADYLVSLHSDSAGDRSGVMVAYYYSLAGKQLAYALVKPVCEALGLTFQLRSNSSFVVLKDSKMPAVLIEILNHSSMEDCNKLANPNFRQRVAEELALAYAKYAGLYVEPQPVEKERRKIIMQSGKEHLLIVVPQDKALYIANKDNDTTIEVTRKHYDEHGNLLKKEVESIEPYATWGLTLKEQYGFILLTSGGTFVSRIV